MSKQSKPRDRPWWMDAVIYQIYPRSFADSNGSGVGDLRGIIEKLDYLAWLGVDALWLSPFFPSPMFDFGYDVADYCDVDPVFGDLSDFDALVEAAHARDVRVLIDWVPAHTSSHHPWFVEARATRDNPKRDWYVWRDPGAKGELPNNWVAAFGDRGPAWTLDEQTGQVYLHSFLKEQPDLNWENPEVQEAMMGVLRFWLDRGVDGFRADVIHNIGKHPSLADVDPAVAKIPHCALNDDPATHRHLREIRALLDSYPGDRMMVGEVFLLRTEQVAAYYGNGDELHLNFNFPPIFAPWDAERWSACIGDTTAVLDPIDAWPTWVLSNHDRQRHHTRYGSEARARAAAVLLLTLRGTPFLYMGEELGLEDAIVPSERVVDPGGRDGCRAPIPWSEAPPHGWGPEPWLPWAPDSAARSAEAQERDPNSILHLYRRLLAARSKSAALREGDFQRIEAPEGVLAYRRFCDGDERRVWINFRDESVHVESASGEVEIASDSLTPEGAGGGFTGRLAASQAVILR